MNRMILRLSQNFSRNLKSFDNLETLNGYLALHKPTHTVVYFRASWNPNCRQSDRDAEKLAATHPHLQIVKVDTDLAPKIAKHYAVKAEPEFVFCLHGDEVLRQIGVNYEGLEQKNQKMVSLGTNEDLGQVIDKWVPYGTSYQVYYDQVLKQTYDRQISDF